MKSYFSVVVRNPTDVQTLRDRSEITARHLEQETFIDVSGTGYKPGPNFWMEVSTLADEDTLAAAFHTALAGQIVEITKIDKSREFELTHPASPALHSS